MIEVRLLDPTKPVGVATEITVVPALTGVNAATVWLEPAGMVTCGVIVPTPGAELFNETWRAGAPPRSD